jgi:hypothetical protein
MNQIASYPAFAFNRSTCAYDDWRGNATLATIEKLGLKADVSYPLYGDKALGVDGWAYKAN